MFYRLAVFLMLSWLTGLTWAQPSSCSTPGKDGPSYSAPSYYPGNATAAAGQRDITLGALLVATNAGNTAVAVGDLVMIIQMQDAQYNNSDSIAYGDGSTGRGWTAINKSGQYEFRRVTAVAGSVITVDQNLVNTYTRAAPSAGAGGLENGNRRFQVIRVPQFSNVSLPGGTVSPPAWNGESGGVWVIDVAGTLNMNGTTVDASALGFRGAGGIPNSVVNGATNYVNPAAGVVTTTPITNSCPGDGANNNVGAFKGEGIAGTPRFVRRQTGGGTTLAFTYAAVDLGISGYANAGDFARGAPGNAGGGGTQHNTGGGGGSNVGLGGLGGNSFAFYNAGGTCVSFAGGSPNPFLACNGDGARGVGGLGGGTLASSITALILGGGGGAGDSNNACDNAAIQQAAGGNGGGIIVIRAGAVSNAGSLLANGQNGLPGGRDAAGGGGAGGTVVVLTATNNPNLTIQANGGQGGNTGWNGTGGVAGATQLRGGETQGPAGGGGGGSVVRSNNVTFGSTPQFAGGASGATFPTATPTAVFNAYGSGSGGGSSGVVPFVPTGPSFASNCLPQLAVSKSTTTPQLIIPAATTAAYVLTLTNSGTGGAAGVAVTDTLPSPFTKSSANATVTSVNAAGPNPAAISGTTVPVIGTPGGTVANSFVVLPGGTLTLTFVVSLNGASVGTYQNTATVGFSDPFRTVTSAIASPGGTYANGTGPIGGGNYNSASSTAEDVRLINGTTTLTISKSNGVGTVTAGQTISYTVTVANLGPTAAPGTTLTDLAATGLNCTSVTCTSTAANMCPAGPTVAALQSTGLQITPTFAANTTASFVITCGVTATGQ